MKRTSIYAVRTPLIISLVLIACNILTPQRLMAQKSHPYLLYTTARVDRLKERIKTDTAITNSWLQLKDRCDQWISKPNGGEMESLALAYCVTKDNRYAERAKALLIQLTDKSQWDGMDDRTPKWNSGLGTGSANGQASITYDAIYNYLSPSDRQKISSRIVILGIKPSIDDWISKDKRIHTLNTMGHNWWSSAVFKAGISALAVMTEIPEAKNWATDILEDSKEWIGFSGSVLENKPSTFDPDGGFYESVSYANFGVSEYLLFRLAYTNAISAVKMPYDSLLQKTMDWFIRSSYPRSGAPLMSLNFGDSNDFANGDRPVRLMIALGLAKPDFYWYLKYTATAKFREDMNIRTPLGMLYQPEQRATPENPTLAPSGLYNSIGWGTLRSSWKPNATLLGVKSGFTWNHAHADAGSFVLYHNGKNLLIDGGDVNYGAPEYSSYFVTSRAHNVITFNGEAQDPQDQYHAVKQPGNLYNLIDAQTIKYILADATGPTARNFLRNYRNFLWIGNVILIIDDIKTYEAGKINFLLHYQDTAVKKGPDFEISQGNSAILFRPLYPETLPLGYPQDFPEKMRYSIEYGLKDRTTNVKIPYYAISPPEKTDRVKFVNAIILLDDSNKSAATFTGSSGSNGSASRTNLPVIERFQGNDYLGLRIHQNGKVTEVYINLLADGRLMHRNSIIKINNWETDAYISAITYKEGAEVTERNMPLSYFVANGSYLRNDKVLLFSSLSKVFMNVDKTGERLSVHLQGQPITNVELNYGKIDRLFVNDAPYKLTDDRDKSIKIHLSSSLNDK